MIGHTLAALMTAALVAFASAANCQTPLDRAVSLWLQGDDARALPLLAKLAAGGDSQARLLLARIETADLGPSPFRYSLDPAQSRKLFRFDDGSTFGTSWLLVEAGAGNELAQALLAAKRPDPDLDLIARLNAMGEHQATDYPTRIVALYGNDAMRGTLLADPQLMPDLKP